MFIWYCVPVILVNAVKSCFAVCQKIVNHIEMKIISCNTPNYTSSIILIVSSSVYLMETLTGQA